MITHHPNSLTAIIPFPNLQALYRCQKGILSLLNQVDLDTCSEEKKRDVKVIYELLGHLMLEEDPTTSIKFN